MSDPARIRLALEHITEALADIDTLTGGRERADYLADRIARVGSSAVSR